MSLENGLVIILQQGEYSDRRNLGVFTNLSDLREAIVEFNPKSNKKEPPFEFQLTNDWWCKCRSVHVNNSDCGFKVYSPWGKFPVDEILAHQNTEMQLKAKFDNDLEKLDKDDYTERRYDFEWWYLNGNSPEAYADGGKKYLEAKKEMENNEKFKQ